MGRIRGIDSSRLKVVVLDLVKTVNLEEHYQKCTETYNGGNKRKLSLAMALIGSPHLLLLDEPTSGVDPVARRKIWATLANVRSLFGCTITLTSHLMDECEALCARVGIMVNGQFKCLGPVQHLRTKFGQGFSLTFKFKRNKVNSVPDYKNTLVEAVLQALPSTVLKDRAIL